jgi:hypothetical protein
MRGWRLVIVTAIASGLVWPGAMTHAAEAVGAATSLRPQATQAAPSAPKADLTLNAAIVRDAELATAADGALEVTFLDSSKLSIGPGSTAIVDEFAYSGPGAPAEQFLKYGKGVFRFISGSVPKDKVRIETPTAVIGIRGTTLRTRVEQDGTTTIGLDEGYATIVSRQTGQTIQLGPGEKVTLKPNGEFGPVILGKVEGCPD